MNLKAVCLQRALTWLTLQACSYTHAQAYTHKAAYNHKATYESFVLCVCVFRATNVYQKLIYNGLSRLLKVVMIEETRIFGGTMAQRDQNRFSRRDIKRPKKNTNSWNIIDQERKWEDRCFQLAIKFSLIEYLIIQKI